MTSDLNFCLQRELEEIRLASIVGLEGSSIIT